ncbi:transcriptional regulator [Bacillus anthracis]|nr:transcriptional regulator [Bacillus anthracis]
MHTYGVLIKNLRLEKNMSLQDLSEKTGLSASYIYRLETHSRSNPSIAAILKLNKELNISILEVEQLFNLKEKV